MKTERMMLVVVTQSSGETTKVVMSGFPPIAGKTMSEKTKCCQEHLDHLRKALMLQPRGFQGILGAIITEPTNEEADFGVIFLHSGGYYNLCGDSTFSVTKALIEQGMVEIKEPFTEVVLDTAAGLVKVRAEVKNKRVGQISFQGSHSFYQGSAVVDVPNIGKIHTDIAFGGLYYAFVDPKEVGVEVEPENASELIKVGMKILNSVNEQVKVEHPENPDLKKIDLVTFSANPVKPEHHFKHANIYGNTICVSPAGTSVSAKLATLVAKGEISINKGLIVESLVHPDLIMVGKAIKKVKVGKYEGIVPELSARAYIIGTQQCILEEEDPLKYGFLLG